MVIADLGEDVHAAVCRKTLRGGRYMSIQNSSSTCLVIYKIAVALGGDATAPV